MIGRHGLPRIGSLGRHDARSSFDIPHPGSTLTYSRPLPLHHRRPTTNDAPQERPPGSCRAARVGVLTYARAGCETLQVQSMTS